MGTNRIFLGDVKPGSFTLRLDQVSSGARLTFQFTDKVTVRTASINGKWVMFLGDHPIEPLEQSFHFQNPYVTDVHFDDQDGAAQARHHAFGGGAKLLPRSGGRRQGSPGRRIEAAPAPSPDAPAFRSRLRQPPVRLATPAPSPGVTEEGPATQPGPPLPVVVLDAGHGGDDAGGAQP